MVKRCPGLALIARRRRLLPGLSALALSLSAGCSSDTGDSSTPTPSATPTAAPEYVAEVLIDSSGVPHIYAKSDESLFYAAGYQMAVDRLYQMEMLRRFAFGRLSEVLGDIAFNRDVQALTFDFPRWGRLDCALMASEDPERLSLLHAWVRGINVRIEEVRSGAAPLPFGYDSSGWSFLPERWENDDPCIVLKGAGFALDKTLEFEYAVSLIYSLYGEAMASIELLQPAEPVYSVPAEDRPEVSARATYSLEPFQRTLRARGPGWRPPPALQQWVKESPADARALLQRLLEQLRDFPSASGSNNWAVDGSLTSTGKPLLAGDPHLGFDFFGAPYPLHLNSADAGGTYDVAGFAYPGTPGIAIGHNRRVVWSPTSAFGDVMDLWSVTLDGSSANIGGQWLPVSERHEEIIVRGEGDPAGQGTVETRTYQDIEGYGVLVPGEVLGMPFLPPLLNQWTGFSARPARWFMELNRVTDLDDFEAAVDRMKEMNYNFIGADASGISLRVGVDVPVRQDVSGTRAPWMTMDASDPLSLWTGSMLEQSRLPHSRGLTTGYLATANNDPFGFTDNGRIDDDPFFYGAFFDPGYRATRITHELERLTQAGPVTLEAMFELQMDTRSTLADNLIPLLSQARAQVGIDPALDSFKDKPELDAVIAALEQWDRRMARDAYGALLFNAYLQYLSANVLQDDIPSAYDFAMSLQAIYVIKVVDLALRGEYSAGDFVLQEGRDTLLLKSIESVVSWLKKHYGTATPSQAAFQDFKQTRFDDAFGYQMPVFTRASDGGEDTICVSQNISFGTRDTEWLSTYVSVERMVATFDAEGVPQIYVNYPVGAAADPSSTDTLTANQQYLDGQYTRLLFVRAEIEAQVRERRWIQMQ